MPEVQDAIRGAILQNRDRAKCPSNAVPHGVARECAVDCFVCEKADAVERRPGEQGKRKCRPPAHFSREEHRPRRTRRVEEKELRDAHGIAPVFHAMQLARKLGIQAWVGFGAHWMQWKSA